MATETKIQQFVHALEEGGWVRRIRAVLLLAAIAFVTYFWFFKEGSGFKGLSHAKAIEQAQIAREVARGHGFSTQVIRPAAIRQFQTALGSFPLARTPDTYHAPLNPLLNALVFKLTDAANEGVKALSKSSEFFERYTYENAMTTKLILYSYDRILAFVQLIFFLLAMLLSYFTARRLFDERLALLGVGLLLLCQKFWDFALSGLPQMLLLFLLSAAAYTLLRAIEARAAEGRTLPWLAAAAALFGLLALAHALTIWIFAGLLVFVTFYFRPRGRAALVMAGIFLLFYGPWMIRNQQVCGNPLGLAWASALFQVRGSESAVMRSMEPMNEGVSFAVFRAKVQAQISEQMGNMYNLLGKVLVAPIFFIALLHPFKRVETAHFRWCIVAMWLAGLLGMTVFGLGDLETLQSNDLHILFVPLMTFYGLAFVLVLWSRLEIDIRVVRIGFLTVLYLVSSIPFLNQFLQLIGAPTRPVQWPPYVPPYIAILGQWTREQEIIASDMPWAVAWYADRKSLWLPMSIRDFLVLNDENQIRGQIVGLYLTPVTGNSKFVSEIAKGEYKDWSPFIMRTANLKDFPLKAVTPLPIDGECVYYSDRDRWTNRED